MKLSVLSARQAAAQFDAWPVPPMHRMAHSLASIFGDHTFFLDRHGLNIVEVIDDEGRAYERGRVVKLATWADSACTVLSPHPEETTSTEVDLGGYQ